MANPFKTTPTTVEGNTFLQSSAGNNFHTYGGAVADGIFNTQGFQSVALIGAGVFDSFPTPHSTLNGNNTTAANIRDTASDALISGAAGPWGMAAGVAIKIADKTGGFSDASKGLGKGNDMLNTMTAIALPGAGWFMKNVGSYKMSDDMKAMSSGYSGTVADNTTAQGNTGKIMFGRSKAKRQIELANFRDNLISGIKLQRDDDFLAQQTTSSAYGMANQFALQGGYNQALARAKHGTKLQSKILTTRNIISSHKDKPFEFLLEPLEETQIFKSGGEIKEPFKFKLIDIAKFLGGGVPEATRLKILRKRYSPWLTFEDFMNYMKLSGRNADDDFFYEEFYNDDEALNRFIKEELETKGKAHLHGDFKKRNHMTYDYAHGGDDNGSFKRDAGFKDKNYGWHPTEDGGFIYKVHPEKMQQYTFDDYKNYWDTHENPNDILDYNGQIYRLPVVQSHKQGGEFNLIPEGALHAHKHHMENDGHITKKGIPVISESEGGEIEQHAEIERDEIIFRLSVTLKIEEYWKRWKESKKDKYAIEAGKLLAIEIMENTHDRTGLIDTV